MITTCPACGTEVTEARDPLDGPILLDEDSTPHTCAYWGAIAKAMSEDALESEVRRMARQLGLKAYHPWKLHARRASEGYPDWTIAGPRGVIFRELKTQRGKVTPAQREWLDTLIDGGADAAVWRPSHLLDGTVAREMAALAGMRVSA